MSSIVKLFQREQPGKARFAELIRPHIAIDHLRPWLVKVTYHRYVDLYRRRKRLEFDSFDESAQEAASTMGGDEIVNLQEREAIRQAMRTLSDDQRDTLIMHDLQGYTEEETARKLNISTGTVKSRLHRARTKFREAITPGTFSRA